MLLQLPSQANVVSSVTAEFVRDIIAVFPRLLSGTVFLVLVYLLIRFIKAVLRSALGRLYADEEQLIVDLGVTMASLLLWFGAGLTLLKIVGMGDVAASLGTATGFVALGVAFALKEMLADTVAGVYLLQDADFNEGDRVTTASVTGTVTGIDLRKTRIRGDDGDLIVVANRDVEKKWVQEVDSDGEVEESAADVGA
ncbi:mechanosensitive ion channel family protein [Halonotius roseus]|uniref:Mechanosensitive ion channel n=1 Tax=Halonotius roseus TaxID=2511997 RepID=A0A544QKK5_9EURY|nr:mechanosensitive ion channel domain-containing protein [Halonotius roseus]TQQ78884.1 mechanosensitive ion channel [Halonotius roseus]